MAEEVGDHFSVSTETRVEHTVRSVAGDGEIRRSGARLTRVAGVSGGQDLAIALDGKRSCAVVGAEGMTSAADRRKANRFFKRRRIDPPGVAGCTLPLLGEVGTTVAVQRSPTAKSGLGRYLWAGNVPLVARLLA